MPSTFFVCHVLHKKVRGICVTMCKFRIFCDVKKVWNNFTIMNIVWIVLFFFWY